MKYPVIVFPWSRFTVSVDGNTLISEASDMENRHLQPLYDDSVDRGFAVQFDSKSNGPEVVTFVVSHTNRDNEGDIMFWDYVPTAESIRKFPHHVKMTATVFND
jgi:hypothetical protein